MSDISAEATFSERARQVLLDIRTGLAVLAAFAAAGVWLVGVAATVHWLIGAAQ